jgi:hypothetical protein
MAKARLPTVAIPFVILSTVEGPRKALSRWFDKLTMTQRNRYALGGAHDEGVTVEGDVGDAAVAEFAA